MLGRPIEELRIATCHLGNGASTCSVKFGKSIDTSMGFTPQDGLPMGTRAGAIERGHHGVYRGSARLFRQARGERPE